jgi:predicted Zn-dependent peptidase
VSRRRRDVSPTSVVRGAAAQKRRLDNGLTVVLCPRPTLAQAYVAVYFGVGSRHETQANNGITHVLEHMLFRGTKSFADPTALNAAAEELGGFLEGATYRDHLVFATGCHPSAVGDAIAILGELVQTPRYRGAEVEKQILREELLETVDARGRMIDIDNITHESVFGRLGLGMPIEGTLKNLERIDRLELEDHRKQYLVGANAVVSVAGPIDPAATLEQVRRAFGRLQTGAAPSEVGPSAPERRPVLTTVRDSGSQIDLRLTFRGVPVQHPEYPALVLLARLLADGLASRMHADLVDRRGLAYALSAGLTTYSDTGLFDFEVAVAPDKAAELCSAILEFASGAERFRYTDSELQRTLRRYQFSMQFMADAAHELASWYGRAALFGIEDETHGLGARIAGLSLADLHGAARRVFRPEGLVVTAVGDLGRSEQRHIRKAIDAFAAGR